MRSETLKTMGVSIGSSLFTMVLVLACSAGAGKLGADDSSDPGDNQDEGEDLDEEDDEQNGSGGDDDDGDDGDDGGLADLIADVAEMAVTIAAQQATIAQLELEMAQTLRWETVEVTCSEEGESKDVGLSSVGAVTATAFYRSSWEYESKWNLEDNEPDLEDDGTIGVYCASSTGSHYRKYWLVTVGYER